MLITYESTLRRHQRVVLLETDSATELEDARLGMMTSNILSRFLPSNTTAPSIYEDLRAHDEGSEPSDIEERAGMAMDEANLGASFHDYELDHADVFDGNESQMTTESTAFLPSNRQGGRRLSQKEATENRRNAKKNSNWLSRSPRILEDDGDDDVPASLLIEGDDEPGPSNPQRHRGSRPNTKDARIPGATSKVAQAQWEATQAQHRLHEEQDLRPRVPGIPKRGFVSNPREKAMWTWINASNLDHFVADVYDYYTGAGIWCICLARVLNLL